MNGVVHIDTNNFPCEYKIDELVRNATPGDAKAEEEEPESFSVLPVKLDPVEQTIRSILSAVSETLDIKDSTSILEPPPDVVGFKRQVHNLSQYSIFTHHGYIEALSVIRCA